MEGPLLECDAFSLTLHLSNQPRFICDIVLLKLFLLMRVPVVIRLS